MSSDGLSWTTYNPSWTSSSTNPSIGNGSITGRYKTIGKTVFVHIQLVWGSSTSGGSGLWQISLPVTAYNSNSVVLNATYLDNGTHWYVGTAYSAYAGLSTTVTPVWEGNTAYVNVLDSTVPFTWGSADSITIAGSYESS